MQYVLLFFSALLAASIFPAQSEALFAGFLLETPGDFWALWAAASVGNTVGSILNWALGRYMERWQHRKWFPIKVDSLAKAQTFFQRYGWSALLLSWMPIIGDPITVVAGLLRMPLIPFIILVAIAKSGRYWAVGWFIMQM